MPDSDTVRVMNRLREVAAAASFLGVQYDASGDPSLSDVSHSPVSVEVNEVSSEWETDSRYGRGMVYQPIDWRFDLVLAFDREVDLQDLRVTLSRTVTVPRDQALGLRQITLKLKSDDVSHPPREGSGGTRVTLSFDADIERA